MKVIEVYKELLKSGKEVNLNNWINFATEKGVMNGDKEALTAYFKVNHLDSTLDDILLCLVHDKDFIRENQIEFSQSKTPYFDRTSWLYNNFNEEDLREFFNELVKQGAKELTKTLGKQTFAKNI